MNNEFYEYRKQGLGGTDMSAIMGVNPYKTAFQVWQDKTNESIEFFEGNIDTVTGQHLESYIVDRFKNEYNVKDVFTSQQIIHKEYNYFRCNIDGIYVNQDGSEGILECKTSKDYSKDQFQTDHYVQIQWYLYMSGLDEGVLAYLSKTNRASPPHIDYFDIKRDDKLIEKLIGVGHYFWNENVLKMIPPDDNGVQVEIQSEPGKEIEADTKIISAYENLNLLRKQIKDLSECEQLEIDKIKEYMMTAELLKNNDKIIATWKTGKETFEFDKKRFEKENKQLFEKYLVTKQGSRRFLLK